MVSVLIFRPDINPFLNLISGVPNPLAEVGIPSTCHLLNSFQPIKKSYSADSNLTYIRGITALASGSGTPEIRLTLYFIIVEKWEM